MSVPLSIGVVLPTLNSARLLPGHLESMQPWLELAAEIVVVDSNSSDGSVELIRQKLRHSDVRVHQHPRGLYQSWNFGLAQIRARYAYLSTIGDSISRQGLEHLHAVAESLRCDVVVSKPDAVDSEGRRLKPTPWPIDDICGTLRVESVEALDGVELFLFALVNCTGAILGSSASNLYRTECLQQRPFPTQFGTVGDGAWGMQNALDVRLGVTRQMFSTFRHHPKSYDAREYHVNDLTQKLYELGVATCQQRAAQDAAFRDLAARLSMPEIIVEVGRHLAAQRRLERCRHGRWPWSLNPSAWQARHERGLAFTRMHEMKSIAIDLLRADAARKPE